MSGHGRISPPTLAAGADHRQSFLELTDQLRHYPILRRIVENETSWFAVGRVR
jgi:hypothetical protein